MKLIIDTQHKENYGAHAWDGKGECPQYWKFKGGSTYVVENVSVSSAMSVKDIVREIRPLIESNSEGFQEYILDWGLYDNDEVTWDKWEAPWFLKKEDDNWKASRKPTHWTVPVEESYTMLAEGGRENYGYVKLGEVA